MNKLFEIYKENKEGLNEFFSAGKNYTTLGCCDGDYCTKSHDTLIKGWLNINNTTSTIALLEGVVEELKRDKIKLDSNFPNGSEVNIRGLVINKALQNQITSLQETIKLIQENGKD